MLRILISLILISCTNNSKNSQKSQQVLLEDRLSLNINSTVKNDFEKSVKQQGLYLPSSSSSNSIDSGKNQKQFLNILKYSLISFDQRLKNFLERNINSIHISNNMISEYFILNGEQLFLNESILNQRINDWCKWQYYTAIKKDPHYDIECNLSEDNTIVQTIHYNLYRVIGELLANDSRFFPSSKNLLTKNLELYPLVDLEWSNQAEVILHKSKLSQSTLTIFFYNQGVKVLGSKYIQNNLKEIQRTSFINFMSIVSPKKDFVESVASYIHTIDDAQKNTISTTYKGEIVGDFESCWQRDNCEKRKEIIEDILERAL